MKENKLRNIFISAIIVLSAVFIGNKLSKWNPEEDIRFVRRFQAFQYGNKTYGSGFNIKYKGKYYIITNQHVCAVSARLNHPEYAVVNGELQKIISISNNHDLCALESDMEDGFELASKELNELDKLYLIGHPRGLDLVIREGRLISKNLDICVGGYSDGTRCRDSNQISALAYGGNSGSPILNEDGKVVGVLYAGSGVYPNEPFTVPFYYLEQFLNTL